MTDTTDRELLERAARAAGRSLISGHHDDNRGVLTTLGWWNPRDSSADALELAVKLRINIEFMRTMGGDDAGTNCWPLGRGDCGAAEHGDDPAAATRRAITRAAASMDPAPQMTTTP